MSDTDAKAGATLLRLQEIDLQILRAEKRLDELPVKKKILAVRHKAREVQALRAKAAELHRRLERGITKNEDETAQVSQKLDAEQAKVMSGVVSNPKELQHISREIDSLRRRKEKLEMDDLALMERVEKAKGQIEKVDAAIAQLGTQESRLTEEFRAAGGELQVELERLRVDREKTVAGFTKRLLERYEALRKAKGGVAAAALKGGTCTACHMELPAERVEELLAGPDVAVCPTCRRLLVVRGMDGDA